MPETQSQQQRVLEKHSVEEIPEINPREFGRGKTFIAEKHNGEQIIIGEGDVYCKGYNGEFSVVLSVTESTGIVHYDLEQRYYGFIPARIIKEDLTARGENEEPKAQIIEDPWGLRNDNEDE